MAGSPCAGHADHARGKGGDHALALGPDVEESGAEGEGDGEPGEDQRGGAEQDLAHAVRIAEHALGHAEVDVERILAHGGDEDRADEERTGHGEERAEGGGKRGARGEPAGHAPAPGVAAVRPVMYSPSVRSLVAAAVVSWTRRPS